MARPPRRGGDAVSTTLRLTRTTLDRLDAAADERGVGRNWLITKLIEEGLDRLIPVEELTMTRRAAPEPTGASLADVLPDPHSGAWHLEHKEMPITGDWAMGSLITDWSLFDCATEGASGAMCEQCPACLGCEAQQKPCHDGKEHHFAPPGWDISYPLSMWMREDGEWKLKAPA